MTAAAPSAAPRRTAAGWIRENLFKNWWSGLVTVIAVPVLGYALYRGFLFVFVNGQWEAVSRNLTLFMQGTFPRDQQWRLISQIILFALAFGIGAGTNSAARQDRAADAGLAYSKDSIGAMVRRMWSLVLFISTLLYFATVDPAGSWWNPFLVVGGAALAAFLGYQARLLPRGLRNLGWLLMAVTLILGFQVVSGFDSSGWWPLALILGIAAYVGVPADRIGTGAGSAVAKAVGVLVVAPIIAVVLEAAMGLIGFGLTTGGLIVASIVVAAIIGYLVFGTGDIGLRIGQMLVRVAAAALVAGGLWYLYGVIDGSGIGWDEWSGLHLTLMTASIAIVLSFPLGLLLALARRSTLPALRYMATGYIEFIRGVPLISLLFMGQYVLAFFFPADVTLSRITRAIVAMALFTAAYVAEIVRGGLQSLPKGQTEAGQALGLAPPTIMRRIVLPQALRAVIPAMVGQFISLFKDTSLLTIIGILEFLGVREIVHAQADFRGVAIAETLVFVAFGYWAFAFAMSRESQRLERRLRVSR